MRGLVPQDDPHHPAERRIEKFPAVFDQFAVHGRVVRGDDMAYHFVGRFVGLYHDRALFFAAGPARYLAQQLVSPFEGPEIGIFENVVRIEYADGGYVVEIQAFGDHLGADQDVRFALFKGADDALVRVFSACGVRVHA